MSGCNGEVVRMGCGRPSQLDPCSCADPRGSRVAHSVGPFSREWAVASRVARTRRTSRKTRHLTGVGRSAVPAGDDLPAPDVIADVSADTRSQPALTPHMPDAHRPVEASEVELCNLPARDVAV
jgi:hypothetical protein